MLLFLSLKGNDQTMGKEIEKIELWSVVILSLSV